MIVNNRPDGEEPGQPLAADIEAAARAAGIAYRHIPIRRGIGPSDVEAMQRSDARCGDGKMLAFCRSGTARPCLGAGAREQAPREEIEQAAAAGFDLGPIAHLL